MKIPFISWDSPRSLTGTDDSRSETGCERDGRRSIPADRPRDDNPRRFPNRDRTAGGRNRARATGARVPRVDVGRREFGRLLTSVVAFGTVATGTVALGSTPTLAVETTWTANGTSIETESGEITSIFFGDAADTDGDELVVEFEGLADSGRTLELAVRLKGADDGDADGWGGSPETDWETMATETHTLDDHHGVLTFTWEEAFGEDLPVDVTAHSEIAIDDFEADELGDERVRGLDLELSATIQEESLERTRQDSAEITVVHFAYPPTIDDVTTDTRPGRGNIGIEVDYAVSSGSADLSMIEIELFDDEGEFVDEETIDVEGETEADGFERFEGLEDGAEYEVVLTVVDQIGESATDRTFQAAG